MKWDICNVRAVRVLGASVLWLTLFATVIGGCVGAMAPREAYDPPFSEQFLDPLLGSTKDEVEEQLGKPVYEVYKDDKSYFVYSGNIDTAGLVVGFPTLPVWTNEPVCSLLEFGYDERLKSYERVGGSKVLLLGIPVGGVLEGCKKAFWSEDELAAHKDDLRERVRAGDVDVDDAEMIYQYATGLSVPEAWQWYCLSAHLGEAKAQYKLGSYYRLGFMSSRGSARSHEKDVVRAFVWYTLSFQGGYATAKLSRDRLSQDMTPAQIAESERLAAEWEPNPAECEVYSDKANAP
jgi:hypothetical protein